MWHFISSLVLGGRDVGLSLDLGFVWRSVFFKMEFCWVGGGGGFTLMS